MTPSFGPEEFTEESFAFAHGTYRVAVHLHPACATPSLLERSKSVDPILAWIYVRAAATGALAHTLNAQCDAMMAQPFFLNVHEGAIGRSVAGSGRASFWTNAELTASIRSYLDDLAPSEAGAPPEAVARAHRFVRDLLAGRIIPPDQALDATAWVSESVVYANVRGLQLAAPDALAAALDEPSVDPRLAALVRGCVPSAYDEATDTLHLERERFAWWDLRERVFVNVLPHGTTALRRCLVDEVLDRPDDHPGVELLRLLGSRTIGTTGDGLTVLTRTPEASERVVRVLARYQQDHAADFGRRVPATSNPVLRGVAVGSEPAGRHAGVESFSSLRLRLIAEALREARSERAFQGRVDERFRANGIDPAAPHRNLAASPDAPEPARKRRWWWPWS